MPEELTNMLSKTRQVALVRDYYFRLGVVVVAVFISIGIVASILLVPTYLFLVRSGQAKESHLANIQSTLVSYKDDALSTNLNTLLKESDVITALSRMPSASAVMRLALALPHPGIALSGLTYTPALGKHPGVLALSGIAQTRDALQKYQLALQGSSFAVSAGLSVCQRYGYYFHHYRNA